MAKAMTEKEAFAFLGKGFDTFAREGRQRMLDVKDFIPYDGDSGLKYEVCTSEEQINKSLDVKVEIGGSYRGLDFSARAAYAQSLTQQKNAVTVLAMSVRKRKGEVSVAKWSSPKPTSAKALFQQGGDSYMSYVEEGGLYVASYQFLSTTQEEKMKISAGLTAKYKGTFDADIGFEMEKVRTETKVNYIWSERNFGGSGGAGSEDKVYEFAKNFLTSTLSAPLLLTFKTSSYTNISDYPKDFDAIANYTKSFTDPSYFDRLPCSLARLESQATLTQVKTKAALRLYSLYKLTSDGPTQIQGHLNKVETTLKALSKFRKAFNAEAIPDPKEVFKTIDDQIDLSSLNLPLVELEWVEGSWCGKQEGNKSSTFQRSWVNSFIYPKAVSAAGQEVLCQLTVTYGQRDPRTYTDSTNADLYTWDVVRGNRDLGTKEWPTIDKGAEFGPGEISAVGIWTVTGSERSSDIRDTVSGMQLERRREGQETTFNIRHDKGYWGQNFSSEGVTKGSTRVFMGFNLYLSTQQAFVVPSGNPPMMKSVFPINACQAVWVNFLTPKWLTPSLNEGA
jgi:hypothetical protein